MLKYYDTHPELPVDPDAPEVNKPVRPIHLTPLPIAMVFIGGCVGAFARYWVSTQIPSTPDSFPVATLIINLLGAFLLGLLLEGLARLGDDRGVRRMIRLFVGTGFMGAFTTYSTFMVDTNLLISHNVPLTALIYTIATIFGGLACSAIGIQIAARHHKRRIGT